MRLHISPLFTFFSPLDTLFCPIADDRERRRGSMWEGDYRPIYRDSFSLLLFVLGVAFSRLFVDRIYMKDLTL